MPAKDKDNDPLNRGASSRQPRTRANVYRASHFDVANAMYAAHVEGMLAAVDALQGFTSRMSANQRQNRYGYGYGAPWMGGNREEQVNAEVDLVNDVAGIAPRVMNAFVDSLNDANVVRRAQTDGVTEP